MATCLTSLNTFDIHYRVGHTLNVQITGLLGNLAPKPGLPPAFLWCPQASALFASGPGSLGPRLDSPSSHCKTAELLPAVTRPGRTGPLTAGSEGSRRSPQHSSKMLGEQNINSSRRQSVLCGSEIHGQNYRGRWERPSDISVVRKVSKCSPGCSSTPGPVRNPADADFMLRGTAGTLRGITALVAGLLACYYAQRSLGNCAPHC